MGVYLFKKTAAVLLVLLCFSLSANATIFLIEPLESELSNNDSIELGQIAQGETLRIVVQRKSGFGFEWDSITVESSSLPSSWSAESFATDKTLVAMISLSGNAPESIQKIFLLLASSEQPFSQERFSVYVTVKKNLLTASMEELKQDSMVGAKANFRLLLNNESVAAQKVLVSSSLPNYWFEPLELEVQPRQTLDLDLSVFPQSYGTRQFAFTVSSQLNSFEQSFQAELNVFSTLKGKFSSALFGFPFFTVSLLPQFLVNAFLALFS